MAETPGIRQKLSGKWQVRYYDPAGRRRAREFLRKSDAKAFKAAVETDKRREMWVDPQGGSTKFSDLAEGWLASRVDLRAASRARDESYLRNHIISAFGDLPIGRITRASVQTWIGQMGERGLAPATVRQCYWILGSVLAEAVNARYISESPCRKLVLPRTPHRERLYLAPEEVRRLADAIGPAHAALIYSAAYLGCRWGELIGLRRESLDLLRRQVKVVGTIEEIGGRARYVEETKTGSSRRTISLPPFLVEILARHLERAPGSEFVFVGRNGGLLRRSNFRQRYWRPAVARAGLNPALRFHDLRHTCAALLIAQGAHHKEIQARLGHASITTTLNIYGHLWPSLSAQLDEKMDKVFYTARAQEVVSKGDQMGTKSPTNIIPLGARRSENSL